MVIKSILEQLETANHPIAKALHKGENFKVLVIGFKSGMILKEHVTHRPAKLTILSGKVVYREGENSSTLNTFDEVDIPVNITHSVQALEDSLCLLSQG